MRVIFLEDVAGTADAGEVKDVKNGFARNYLLPRALAAPATPDQLQRIRSIEKAAREKRVKYSQEWGEVAELVNGTSVAVEVRVGPSGRLFGSVTSRAIAEKLTEATGRTFDHKQVLLGSAIHEVGDYPVTLRLYREVTAEVQVSVVPEGYRPAGEEPAEDAVDDFAEGGWDEEPYEDEPLDEADEDYYEDDDEDEDDEEGK